MTEFFFINFIIVYPGWIDLLAPKSSEYHISWKSLEPFLRFLLYIYKYKNYYKRTETSWEGIVPFAC